MTDKEVMQQALEQPVQEQQQAEPPPEWLLIKNILDEYGLQAIDFVAEFKAAQQVVGVTHCQCEACKNGNIHDSDCSVHNGDALPVGPCDCSLATPPLPVQEQQQAEPVAWDKPSDNFNAWWDSYRHDGGNPFQTDSFAYWAWAGWKAALAQRPWVKLTDEEIMEMMGYDKQYGYIPQYSRNFVEAITAKLMEKNT